MDSLFITIKGRRFKCDPLGYGNSAILTAKERGQVFYRERFEGELTFRNDDFTRIADVELSNDQCSDIQIDIERDGVTYWAGYFTCSMCYFDFDRRICTVTPQPRDRFEPFMTSLETSVNITQLPSVAVNCKDDGHYNTLWRVNKAKDFMGVVRALVGKINPDVLVASSFFESAENPATNQANKLLNMCIAQKSDAKRPGASEPATKGDLSFELFTGMMRSLFNVYWNVTEDKIFELEHISYFDEIGTVVNLRGLKGEYGRNNYRYDTAGIPSSEVVEIEGFEEEFIEGRVDYDKRCALGDMVETKFDISTDIFMLKSKDEDMPEMKDSGFFLFACDCGGQERSCAISETGLGNEKMNGALAMSTLVKEYWGWNRSLKTGIVFGQQSAFRTAKRRIIQELPIVECIDLDVGYSYETGLTDIVNHRAKIREKKKYVNGNVDLVLEYGDLMDAKRFLYTHWNTRWDEGTKEFNRVYVVVTLTEPPPIGGLPIKFKVKYRIAALDGVSPDYVYCDEDWRDYTVMTDGRGSTLETLFVHSHINGLLPAGFGLYTATSEIAIYDETGMFTSKVWGGDASRLVNDITCD